MFHLNLFLKQCKEWTNRIHVMVQLIPDLCFDEHFENELVCNG